MQLRRLTETGIQQFREYLHILRVDGKLAVPVSLLADAAASEPAAAVSVEPVQFRSRRDSGAYFYELFQPPQMRSLTRDVGVWSWLSLFYFDQICPASDNGKREPSKEDFRYIPAFENYRKYYRHLLYGPFHLYESYRARLDDAQSLLVSSVDTISEVVEQIASRIDWVSNPAVVCAATRLYVDQSSGEYKYGTSGKKSGTPRRLSKVLDQFDLTFDLHGMSPEEILKLLPREFDRFKGGGNET